MSWPGWGNSAGRCTGGPEAGQQEQLRADIDAAEVQGLIVDEVAYAAWQRGEVSPAALTVALDYRGLYGPKVDIACGVQEPAVDQWECGALYPTWEQLQALAVLTGFRVRFFVQPVTPEGAGFLCIRRGRGKGCHQLPRHSGPAVFDPSVVAQCTGTRAFRGDDPAAAPTVITSTYASPVVGDQRPPRPSHGVAALPCDSEGSSPGT